MGDRIAKVFCNGLANVSGVLVRTAFRRLLLGRDSHKELELVSLA